MMKGIILAGGTGSRLYPLTKVTNKHLLPVGRYPMIYYPLFKLKQAGICDVLIVTGKQHMGSVVALLGSGSEMNMTFTYKIQDESGGVAEALGLARSFVGRDLCTVILGDNIFEDSLVDFVEQFRKCGTGSQLLLKDVDDPRRYGVAEVDGGRVISIEEKPQYPKSNYCVTGIYMYDPDVFDIIGTLRPSGRGELEISDVNSEYLKRNKVSYSMLSGWWTDAGTHDSLQRANDLSFNLDLTGLFSENEEMIQKKLRKAMDFEPIKV